MRLGRCFSVLAVVALATTASAARYLVRGKLPPRASVLHDYGRDVFLIESADAPAPVHHARGVSEPLVELAGARISGVAAATAGAPAHGLYVVGFPGPIDPAWTAGLTAAGAEVLDYIPSYAYLVWCADGDVVARISALSAADLVAPLPAFAKLTPALRPRLGGPSVVTALLTVHRGRGEPDLARFEPFGDVLWHEPLLGQELVALRTGATRLLDLAAEPSVISLSLWEPSSPDGEVSKRLVDGTSGPGPGISPPGYLAWLQSKGVSGAGVTVAVIDSGLDVADSSGHLQGRIVRVSRGEMAGTDGHGHHVAGIIAGDCRHPPDSDGYLWGVGVAPEVALVDIPRLRPGYLGSDREQVRDAVSTPGTNGVRATVASCSWNAGLGSDYTLIEREWDAFARDADDVAPGSQPLILSFSAGNAGAGRESLTRPHAAKNLITVGNSWSYRPALGRSDHHHVALTSSRGPAADGRVKPDLVAPGTDIAAAYASPLDCNAPVIDGEHAYCTGTSMSQPHVAGAAALLVEAWSRSHAGVPPSPALVKAALVNGARDLPSSAVGPPLSTGSVPNFDEGWGLIDLTASIAPTASMLYLDQSTLLDATGDRFVWEFVVADPARPLKATLAWTDAPGAVGASPALVNDLDLTLQTATTSWRGNGFLNGWSDSGVVVADDRNNVENVFLEAPPDDAWELEVFAANVPGDGVPGVGDGTDQDFALVVTNALLPEEDGGARILGGTLRCGARADLLVWDRGVSGSVDVEVSSSTEVTAEVVRLSSSPGSKLFRGGIDLVVGAPAPDGLLQVRDGDLVELRYVDAVDGRGGFDVVKRAQVTVDCRAPTISNVRATPTSDRTAVIEWDTDEPATSRVEVLRPVTMSVAWSGLGTSHRIELAGLEPCSRYEYRVTSGDAALNLAIDDNGGAGHWFRTLRRAVVYRADFESDDGGFTHTGTFDEWEWGAPLEGPVSAIGDRLWGTDLDGKYAKGGRSPLNGNFLLFSPTLDLGGGGAWLRFRYWHDIATDGDTDDGAWIEAWNRGAWIPVLPRGGYGGTVDSDAPARADGSVGAWDGDSGGTWREAEVDLSGLSGPTRIKLHLFEEDSVLAGTSGLYIDEFEVFRYADCERGVVSLSPRVVSCTASLAIEVVDGGLDRDPAVPESTVVRVASPAEPAGEWLMLTESAASSARFTGAIATDGGPAQADGRLQVGDGSVVGVTYEDADDGSGGAVIAHDGVDVDCQAPRLGGVAVIAEDDRAIVEWWSDGPATSLVRWGPTAALGATVEDRTLALYHRVRVPGLAGCSPYFFVVGSSDAAGNLAYADDSGQPFSFRTSALRGIAFRDDFEADLGWSLSGEWERGRPRGHHLVTPTTLEPNAATSGASVLGLDLSGLGSKPGRYEPGIVNQSATTPVFDLSALGAPRLEYHRWLGVERAPLDLAVVEASANSGLNWTTVWSNPTTGDVNDRFWTQQSIDLTPIQGSTTAQLRLSMTANTSTELMGFQIDDLVVADSTLPPFRACGSDLVVESLRVDDGAGNGDGIADPGETVLVPLRIANHGNATATAIAVRAGSGRDDLGSLSRPTAMLADLAPGASAETSAPHLEVIVAPCADPGSRWPFQVVLGALDGASTHSFELVVGGAISSVRVASMAAPVAIPNPDPAGVATTIEVLEDGIVTGLTISVDLDHAEASDLFLILTGPRGASVTLHAASGTGSPYTPRAYPPTTIDGPSQLASLLGHPAGGVWSLRAIDGRAGNAGTLTGWTLDLTVASRPSSVSAAASPLHLVRRGVDVVASWSPAAGAERYRLERSIDKLQSVPQTVAEVLVTSVVDPGAVAGPPNWYYRVRGIDPCGREGP